MGIAQTKMIVTTVVARGAAAIGEIGTATARAILVIIDILSRVETNLDGK